MAEEQTGDSAFMSRARLWLRVGTTIKKPTVIVGFPGIGRIGELVTNYFLKNYEHQLIGVITSPYFSTQTIVDKHGVAHILAIRIYKIRPDWDRDDLLVVKGDQHQEIMGGEYESTELLLNFLEKHQTTLIVTIGGMYSSDSANKRVYFFASNRKIVSSFEKIGLSVTQSGVPVVGAAGIIVGLTSMKKMSSACLLGETSGEKPDVEVAKSITLALGKYFKLESNIQLLDREGEKIERIIKLYEESYAKIMENPSISKVMSEGKSPEYVS